MKLADGYEDAFVGTTISAFSRKQVALYDYDKCLFILIDKWVGMKKKLQQNGFILMF